MNNLLRLLFDLGKIFARYFPTKLRGFQAVFIIEIIFKKSNYNTPWDKVSNCF